MDKSENIETWNKKKIFITLLIVAALLGFLFKSFTSGKNKDFLKFVKGVSTQKDANTKDKDTKNTSAGGTSLPIQAVIKEKLDELKKEVNKLDVAEIATSSPQIQKIINDLNSFKEYPVNEAKEICQRVCSGF